MITFFTIPKSFTGRLDWIQRNAIGSWTHTVPGAQVILFGDDPGVDAAAARLGVEHVPAIDRTDAGTPRLDVAFAGARAAARHPLLCFVNADIVLLDDFRIAAERVAALPPPLLVVGETWDTDLSGPLDFSVDWQVQVQTRSRTGNRRGAGALDYFLYTRDLYDGLPPFAVGRVGFDNWLVWKARERSACVVDATPSIRAVHQRHDYSHLAGGRAATRIGSEEADYNLRLVGPKSRLYTRYDATHVLGRRLRRNLLATFRLKENARKALYKTRVHMRRPPRDHVQARL